MTTRILPESEWTRLEGHDALGGHPLPPAGSTLFVVAEDGDQIVGVWALVTVLHLEPVWLAPSVRGGMVIRRMWRRVTAALAERGVRVAFAFADRDDIRGYLERLGLSRLPFTTFLFHEDTPCRKPSSRPPSPAGSNS